MPDDKVIAVDLADVENAAGKHITTLGWGDPVEVVEQAAGKVRVRLTRFRVRADGTQEPVHTEGFIRTKLRGGGGTTAVVADRAAARVLKVDFVDVQQGDGTVIESPDGQVVLLDGGENQLFARYLAGRYSGTTAAAPKEIAAIVVSHGDADHFEGLARIADSETNDEPKKRIFIRPERVFHNGLVKRPGGRPDAEMLGATKTVGGKTLITGLEDDLLAVADKEMNGPFKTWKKALKQMARGQDIAFRRLALGDDDAFDFLAGEGIRVDVLGPLLTTEGGVTGLEFLGTPERRFGHPEENATTFSGRSASHTINGHSIVLRLRYGKFGFLFAGDLNEQSELRLVAEHKRKLRSEVFKVPHHGSADYLRDFLKAVGPVVSIVSSGDEGKDHIHPRATLVAGLGRYSRSQDPVLFVTEMVAFFRAEGYVAPAGRGRYFSFSRAAFGIVKVRTDGERLLVYTNSGQADMKEAYAYTLERGRGVPQKLLRV